MLTDLGSYYLRSLPGSVLPIDGETFIALNKKDISERKLPKNTTGVVVTEIFQDSPLMFISINDVIVEIQKKKVINSDQFSDLVKETIDKGEKTLYLAIYNSSNQRSYITVRLK